jgi:hypothetical protein
LFASRDILRVPLERRRGGLERANGIVRVRLGTRRRDDDDDDEGGFGSGFGFVRFAVVARGAFVTLRIGNPGFGDEIAGDVGFAGHGHVLLAYAVPRVTSATPRSVREAGGSVVFIAGVDFPGGAAFDAGAAAARCAFAAGTRGDGDDALELFAPEAAFVSSTLTRCETPSLVFSSRDGRRPKKRFRFRSPWRAARMSRRRARTRRARRSPRTSRRASRRRALRRRRRTTEARS